MNNNTNFETELNNWLERVKKIYHDSNLTIDPKGIKYTRIVHTRDNGGSSVLCFIDKSNGDVLKPATWKAPAKHARGNIFEVGKEGIGKWGANYLR